MPQYKKDEDVDALFATMDAIQEERTTRWGGLTAVSDKVNDILLDSAIIRRGRQNLSDIAMEAMGGTSKTHDPKFKPGYYSATSTKPFQTDSGLCQAIEDATRQPPYEALLSAARHVLGGEKAQTVLEGASVPLVAHFIVQACVIAEKEHPGNTQAQRQQLARAATQLRNGTFLDAYTQGQDLGEKALETQQQTPDTPTRYQ